MTKNKWCGKQVIQLGLMLLLCNLILPKNSEAQNPPTVGISFNIKARDYLANLTSHKFWLAEESQEIDEFRKVLEKSSFAKVLRDKFAEKDILFSKKPDILTISEENLEWLIIDGVGGRKFTLRKAEGGLGVYNEDVKRNIEKSIAKAFVAQLEEYFPFVKWEIVGDSDIPKLLSHQLIINLIGRRNPNPKLGAKDGQDIYLEYSSRIASKEVKQWREEMIEDKLFDYHSKNQETHNCNGRLQNKITDVFQKRIIGFESSEFDAESSRFLKRMWKFISSIPLTREIHIPEENREYIIPISWQDPQFGNESVFSVEFSAQVPGEELRDGEMYLSRPNKIKDESRRWYRRWACRVKYFSHLERHFDGYDKIYTESGDTWDRITKVVPNAVHEGDLKVFMKKYIK